MGVYDTDLIMSWTPHEYLLKLKGAQHSRIDEYEKMAKTAMAHRYATNAKRAKETSIFNAAKTRRMLEKGFKGSVAHAEKQTFKRMKQALKDFTPTFIKKGG